MSYYYERIIWGDKLRAKKDVPGEKVKKRRIYYLALYSLTIDDDGICWANIYDAKGNFVGNYRLDIFKTLARHIFFKAKELYAD